jgi:hypothetical protein
MAINKHIPTYQALFGALDFEGADEGRSVFSPAAYLVDLLQLVDDRFGDADILDRRPDIADIPLNGDNTFTLRRHIDIVIELLERRASATNLRAEIHPLTLPFDLQSERVRKLLAMSGISAARLRRLFAISDDPDAVARERLGLSAPAYELLVSAAASPEQLRRAYGLAADEDLQALRSVARFSRATGLDGARLRELLFQGLAVTALDREGRSERIAVAQLFVHGEGAVLLDDDERNLIWAANPELAIPVVWLDRVHRLIRLAAWTGLSFTQLDRVLRTCCGSRLDAAALRRLAIVVDIAEAHRLDLELAAALIGDLDALGIGDDEQSAAPFDRVFNGRRATLARSYLPSGRGFVPAAYRGFQVIELVGDLLAPEHKAERLRIQQALGLSFAELSAIVSRFQAHALARATSTRLTGALDRQALALLHRISSLATILDCRVAEILDLLDVLERDPSVRSGAGFDLLIDEPGASFDTYAVLEGDDIGARVWLIQTLIAVRTWMRQAELSSEALRDITLGVALDDERTEARALESLTQLVESLTDVLVRPAAIEAACGSARAARVAVEVGASPAHALFGATDGVVLTTELARSEAAAYAWLQQLDRLTPDDLPSLGARTAARSFRHLVQRGVIQTDGTINLEALPKRVEEFVLATDFSGQREAVFQQIRALRNRAIEQGQPIDDLELELFPSDLKVLGLDNTQLTELYDNLSFAGVIDYQAKVLAPDRFADSAAATTLTVDSGLQRHAPDVFAALQAKLAAFEQHQLVLAPSTWSTLGLRPGELADLIENLRFNGYLDEHDAVLDKARLLTLGIEEFDLAIEFFPHRHAILASLRGAVSEFGHRQLRVSVDDLMPLADRFTAADAHAQLAARLLEEGRLALDEAEALLAQGDAFALEGLFDANESQLVARALKQIVDELRKLRFGHADLSAYEFTANETKDLLEILAKSGLLLPGGRLGFEHVGFYIDPRSALRFVVEGFEDFSKEIFFAIYGVAKRTRARMDAFVVRIAELGRRQHELVIAALAEAHELPAPILTVLFDGVHHFASAPAAAYLQPQLAALDARGQVVARPTDASFRLRERQLSQLAALVSALGLGLRETELALRDQHLVAKRSERLALPAGVTTIDCLLPDVDGQLLLFVGNRYWTYDAHTLELLGEPRPLATLSPSLAQVQAIDAAYSHAGTHRIFAGSIQLERAPGAERWTSFERIFGEVESRFSALEQLDASFVSHDGHVYLFAEGQYVRHVGEQPIAEPGYPRAIVPHWPQELEGFTLPPGFGTAIDAALQTRDGVLLFEGQRFIASETSGEPQSIAARFGRVESRFGEAARVDAVVDYVGLRCLFVQDQVFAYRDGLEGAPVYVQEGYPAPLPQLLPGLPPSFHDGVDAGFTDESGGIVLFRAREFISAPPSGLPSAAASTAARWGRVDNELDETGRVDAAFSGLDGKVYLFSGDQYVR